MQQPLPRKPTKPRRKQKQFCFWLSALLLLARLRVGDFLRRAARLEGFACSYLYRGDDEVAAARQVVISSNAPYGVYRCTDVSSNGSVPPLVRS